MFQVISKFFNQDIMESANENRKTIDALKEDIRKLKAEMNVQMDTGIDDKEKSTENNATGSENQRAIGLSA
ncbi:MAG: hypothetical protein ACX932_06175 [Gammaproteobacteria bacterium]